MIEITRHQLAGLIIAMVLVPSVFIVASALKEVAARLSQDVLAVSLGHRPPNNQEVTPSLMLYVWNIYLH